MLEWRNIIKGFEKQEIQSADDICQFQNLFITQIRLIEIRILCQSLKKSCKTSIYQ
ncbi:unnamed protein product [Paramecium sonneborni]|uniref:Uncharacterized protein n=1 Tax=Paramecium sonneborni TaxID=65129 RepID=A0A8S1NB96_9CILI|nr:unnamed protein product [Paramecium sonneborni]